ncbi:hypothetical protein OH77DRAFT_1426529 [Trametes cingulata]|nr:hypothetical protein OH77DRAFT_1426529 [Trametes cingulata]
MPPPPKTSKRARLADPPRDNAAEHLVSSAIGGRLRELRREMRHEARVSPLRPVAQLEPGSYLGRAFEGLAGGGPSDGSGGSPSSSDDGNDTEDSSRSASSDNSYTDPADNGQSSRKNKKRKKKTRRPVLKPEKPEPYDGRPDAQAFHKFLRQMSEYIAGYKVERSMHASTVSNFLTGNAYRFFVTTVSGSARKWNLRELFVELFNYCFPVDYRMSLKA